MQYALPIISMVDLIVSIALFESPIYWPISLTAFSLSGIAFWFVASYKSNDAAPKKHNLLVIVLSVFYLYIGLS